MTEKYEAFECSVCRLYDLSEIKYLNDVTNLLAEFFWIYGERNTEIILHNVLEKIPNEWIEALLELPMEELCQVPFDYIKINWPDSLKSFVEQCQMLGSLRFSKKTWQDVQQDGKQIYTIRKASFKKQYEIEIMSSLVHQVCQEFNCPLVLDIGSGLGYLDQILHHNFGLRCICLDSSSKYTQVAKDRLKMYPCRNTMNHRTLEVKNSKLCLQELTTLLKEDWNWECGCDFKTQFSEAQQSDQAVLIGLHSCGNLMQDMMKLFCEMEELVAFICVGCCYNKIDLNDFPMSKAAKTIVHETQLKFPNWNPCVSGLRLAAHGTRSHLATALSDPHVEKSMFYRALLEYYIRTENVAWKQPKRHLRATDVLDFETYCKNMLKDHPLGNDETTLNTLLHLYQQKYPLFPRVKILLVLQTLLQPLWEGFVTVDRILYFKEHSIDTSIIALWDDAKSSRNLALCAFKR